MSILFPVPVLSKTRLLRNLLIDYCEFAKWKNKCIKYGMHAIRCAVAHSFAYQPPMQLSETGQGYSLWSEELEYRPTFVNCLQIIHKFKHEHEKEYLLHVIGAAVGPLTSDDVKA